MEIRVIVKILAKIAASVIFVGLFYIGWLAAAIPILKQGTEVSKNSVLGDIADCYRSRVCGGGYDG